MQEGYHFRVFGNNYGMLVMLKSQITDYSSFKEIDSEQVHAALVQNLLQRPHEKMASNALDDRDSCF